MTTNSPSAKILNRFNVNEQELKKLCVDFRVKSLAIFGSIVSPGGAFALGQSDIDFLVEFESVTLDGYFGFLDGLKKIFRYDNIDLVTVASLKNQVIREQILKTQENIYAA